MSTLEHRERPTIMSGKVITYSTAFNTRPGVFGDIHEATGAFEVSASRDLVIVHRAVIRDAADLAALHAALDQAHEAALAMAGADHGNYGRRR